MQRLGLAVTSGRAYQRGTGTARHGVYYLLGVGLAALLLAGFAVYGFVRPSPSIGNATVLIDGSSGGAYVLSHGRLYPAANLASAMLAAGRPDNGAGSGSSKPEVKTVNSSTLAALPKGQMIGITGAPNLVPAESRLVADTWTVCDVSSTDPALAPSSPPKLATTVILGGSLESRAQAGNVAELVTDDGGETSYVLADGRRAKVDLGNPGVSLALGTGGLVPRPISVGLLDAIPAGPDLSAPTIAHLGQAVGWSNQPVGSVFTVELAAGPAYYVVLSDGVQQITPLLSDLIRTMASGGPAQLASVAPAALTHMPVTKNPIPVSNYPTVKPTFASYATAPVICLGWSGNNPSATAVYPLAKLPLPGKAQAVPAPPDASAGAADGVYLTPGHGAVYGQVEGNQAAASGALYLVTDQGVKYPVVSQQALTELGLGTTISPATPQLLSLLPTGPTLDPTNAAKFVPVNP